MLFPGKDDNMKLQMAQAMEETIKKIISSLGKPHRKLQVRVSLYQAGPSVLTFWPKDTDEDAT